MSCKYERERKRHLFVIQKCWKFRSKWFAGKYNTWRGTNERISLYVRSKIIRWKKVAHLWSSYLQRNRKLILSIQLSKPVSLRVTNRCIMRSFLTPKIPCLRIKLHFFLLRMKLLKNCSFNFPKSPIYRCPYSYDCHCIAWWMGGRAISIPMNHCTRNQQAHLSISNIIIYTLHQGWKRKRFNNNEKVQTKLNLLLDNSRNWKGACTDVRISTTADKR